MRISAIASLVCVLFFAACGGRTDLLGEGDMGKALFVPLGAGIKTDVADALLPLGKDLELENMQFDQQGATVKRFGHLLQGATIQPGGGGLPGTWQLAAHKGARVSLSVPGASPLGTFSPTDSAWNIATSDRRGPITTALTKIKAGGNNPRIASGAGFYYLLYLDLQTSGLMHFDMVDAVTGHVAVAQTFLAGGVPVFGYDVLFCNGFAVAVTAENGVGIVFRRLTPSTKTFTTTTFAASFASQAFDATVANATTISVVYANGTAQAAGVDFVPSTSTTSGFAIKDATAANISLDLGRASWQVDLGGSGKIALVTASSTQGVRTQWDLTGGATRTATTTFNTDPAATANIGQLMGFTTGSSAAGSFIVLVTITASPTTNNFTKWGGAIAGANQSAAVLYRSLTLLSKAWTVGGDFFAMFALPSLSAGDGNSYIMRIPSSGFGSQPTSSAPQAIFAVGSSGNIDQFGTQNLGLVRVLSLSASQVITSIAYLNRIGQQADSFFSATTLGVELVTVSHLQTTASPTTGHPVEALDSLLVPGGMIGQYDGATFAEMGFAYAPRAPTLTPGVGAGLTPNSTYWYVFVYSYMDAQGRLWRSGTSIPASVTLTGGQGQVTVGCSTLRITGRAGVGIEVYRGAANDETLFQKVTQIPNDITVDTVSFVDTFTDTQLAQGEDLYTGANDNAILNNDTIPGATFIFIYQNRVWFRSADNGKELWFSNVISPGNGVRFNSQNVVRIDDAHGDIYSAASMDDKVVAIKGDAIYSWAGDGPDDAGNGGYSPPQIVTLGMGSTNPRSVISWRDGVFLQSTADRPGMQMIDRGLSVATESDGSAFGAAVQKYANEQVMSSILIPEQSQVRFYCLSGRVLVYDLAVKAWSTFLIGAEVASAVATNGAALVAIGPDSGTAIWLEDVSGATYTDPSPVSAGYSERIATPWIQIGGENGFERITKMIGRGQTMGDHTLTIQQLTNYNDSVIVGTKTFNETVASTPLWNWEWLPRVQRMAAEKLIISEVSSGAGFKAEGVSLLVRAIAGLNRQPTNTRGP